MNKKKKLLLFDIDGTLILTGGIAASLMAEASSHVLGIPVQWTIEDFVGNTDRSILSTLLHRNGASEAMVDDMVEAALQHYIERLEIKLGQGKRVKILPGVEKLMKKLHKDDRFCLGILTGNVLEGARIKLKKQNLFSYFPIGAFGDDALNRDYLPPVAIQRAEKYYKHFFDRSDVWIIGDSLNDIRCAHANRIRSLAVATGHVPMNDLQAFRPTALLNDLSDTEGVIQILTSK